MGKRCLLWDYTNTQGCPQSMDKVNFNGPMRAVSNWNAWVPPELKGRAPFRPMIHLEPQLQGDEWGWIVNSDQPIVHYFNEPERNGISAEEAANKWFSQVLTLRHQHGKKLVSPSCASDENGQNWLADFMNRVASDPPDYVGLHYYGTDANAARKYIEMMHNKWPQHRVFVTEIASISRDQGQVYAFTKDIANWMDGTDWVEEYGFFGCMRNMADGFVSPAAQLMNGDGSFTPLMEKLMNEKPVQ